MTGWMINEADAEAIATGAGILGTGGGGNPYMARLRLAQWLRQGAKVEVIAPEDIPGDALVCVVGGMGAPTVGIERPSSGWEGSHAVDDLAAYLGKPIGYVACGEIGGGNSLSPLIVAAQTGRKAVDVDGMGRAFPELQMSTFMMGRATPGPSVLHDLHGNSIIFHTTKSAHWAERIGRAAVVAMGGGASLARVMTGEYMRQTGIRGTVRLAWRLGNAVHQARRRHDSLAAAVFSVVPSGRLLFQGKVVDVLRRTTGGFARGNMSLQGSGGFSGRRLEIDFQNEYLIAREDERTHVTVPDMICLIDSDNGEPVTTEILHYGLRVTVLGLPAAKELKTPRSLEFVGPQAFGYDIDFQPMPGDLIAD